MKRSDAHKRLVKAICAERHVNLMGERVNVPKGVRAIIHAAAAVACKGCPHAYWAHEKIHGKEIGALILAALREAEE